MNDLGFMLSAPRLVKALKAFVRVWGEDEEQNHADLRVLRCHIEDVVTHIRGLVGPTVTDSDVDTHTKIRLKKHPRT